MRHCARVAVLVADGLQHAIHQRFGADHVGRQRLVDRRVEGDIARAVHHDVQIGRQLGHVGQIALDNLNPAVEQLGCSTRSLPKVGEDRLLDRRHHPVPGSGRALAAYQHCWRGVWKLGEDLPEQLLADEAGHAGHHDLLAGQQVAQPAIKLLDTGLIGIEGRHGHADLLSVVLLSCAARSASSIVKRPT